MEIIIVDIADRSNFDKKDWPENAFIVFSDEWSFRKKQCQNFIKSQNKIYDRKFHGRKCIVKEVNPDVGKDFFKLHHIQGSNNLGVIYFGLFHESELIGVMSLGRHSRQIAENRIVLDRFCIADGVHVQGGASKLFARCIKWAKDHKYDEIISFSDNRWTEGKIYEILGFSLEKNHKQDYCYVDTKDPNHRISKQSQKKSSSNCPQGMTEFEWADIRGLKKLWDLGKKRWVFPLDPEALLLKQKQSIQCAEQNKNGDFKHSHIRGYFTSDKQNTEVFYSSSYELRCLYLLEQNELAKSFRRADTFVDSDKRSRNPDIFVEYVDGSKEVIEVKPEKFLLPGPNNIAVKTQIEETVKYCDVNGYKFSVWSEKDSGLENDYRIIAWAKKFIAETTGNTDWIKKQKESNLRKAKKFYATKIAEDKVEVWCDYCKENHYPLRLTHDKNIKRNGTYICEKKGGSISGSKPKKKKENPYALEGKKQCTECSEIKIFADFAIDRSRSDGYYNQCRLCQKKKYEAKKRKDEIT